MKKIILILIFSVIYGNIKAQGSNGLAFPSPDNSFLGNSGGSLAGSPVGVDLYTGSALASASICNLVSRQITVPVLVNYIAGKGIKVQDHATSVGLGWQLNAGGSISRVVRGYPDEQPKGYLGTNLWGQVVKGYLADSQTLTQSQSKAITGIDGSSWSIPTADGEPDIFFVKTPFFSLQFTFDENGNAVFPNNSGLKIISKNFFHTPVYNYSSFEVIDADGNEYYFGLSSESTESTTANLFGTDYTFPTTWYLDKIVPFNSTDSITLSYTSFSSENTICHYQSSTSFDYPLSDHKNIDSTPVYYIVNDPKYISNISSATGEVGFTYATDRRDNINAARLTDISLKAYNTQQGSSSTLLKKFHFFSLLSG